MIKVIFPLVVFSSLLKADFSNCLDIKEQIATYLEQLNSPASQSHVGDIHYNLALAYFKDQEIDKAFQHFLHALTFQRLRPLPKISHEESAHYQEALDDYLKGGGTDPVQLAKQILDKYGDLAARNPNWIHLNFLVTTAYANLGQFDIFFERFYNGFPYLGDTFLAYKTRGVLYLRLSQHSRSNEERHSCQEAAFHYLTAALERNTKDSALYKVLIFLAKDDKNDALVLNYLQKMVENEAHIARGDIYLYVREAVALGEPELGQEVIDLARTQYDFSRAISAAQEYLNQCRG